MFKGAVLNIKFGAFYVFSRVFFTPLRYDYPSDVTLVLWQYGSRIRGGLLYRHSRIMTRDMSHLGVHISLVGLILEFKQITPQGG